VLLKLMKSSNKELQNEAVGALSNLSLDGTFCFFFILIIYGLLFVVV